MRRTVSLLLMFAAFSTFVACGSDSSTNPGPASVAGRYTLRTVNGSPLPSTLAQVGDDKLELTADTLRLEEGGAWTESGTLRSTVSGAVTTVPFTDAGTFTLSGTAITLVSAESGTISGSVDSGTLSLTQPGFVAVYAK